MDVYHRIKPQTTHSIFHRSLCNTTNFKISYSIANSMEGLFYSFYLEIECICSARDPAHTLIEKVLQWTFFQNEHRIVFFYLLNIQIMNLIFNQMQAMIFTCRCECSSNQANKSIKKLNRIFIQPCENVLSTYTHKTGKEKNKKNKLMHSKADNLMLNEIVWNARSNFLPFGISIIHTNISFHLSVHFSFWALTIKWLLSIN